MMNKDYKIEYPFFRSYRELYSSENDSYNICETWEAGVKTVVTGTNYQDYIYTDLMANDVGEMIITELGRFKPEGYPERVFFKREFINPDGVKFGNTKCRIATTGRFNKLIKGYAHKYSLTSDFIGDKKEDLIKQAGDSK